MREPRKKKKFDEKWKAFEQIVLKKKKNRKMT